MASTEPQPTTGVATTQPPVPTSAISSVAPVTPTSTATATATATASTQPIGSVSAAPVPNPSASSTPSGGKTSVPKTKTTVGPSSSTIGTGPTQTPASGSNGSSGSSGKSVLAPVIGGIAALLVLVFLVAVFVMRYKKKNRARKRRLDFLGDHSGSGAGAVLGGAGAAAASNRPVSAQDSAARPSTPAGGRPLEMAAIASNPHTEGYDYQQGYQQVPYNGYPEPQYDPYYTNHQHQYQNQFAPVGINSQGTSSPSMTHASVSPKSFPLPPPSTTTGGFSSPRTLGESGPNNYDKNAMFESEQPHVAARNPQLVPEHDDLIKVPI